MPVRAVEPLFFIAVHAADVDVPSAFFTAVVAGTAYWEILLSAKRVEPVILNDFMHGQASLFL